MLNAFRSYLRDERASLTVEAIMVLPLLLWGYFGIFILFDGYRALSSNIRVSYTISDLLSRETNAVTAEYIEGLNDIQDVLTQSPHRTVLRVTVVKYNEALTDHQLEWSYSTAGKAAVTESNLDTAIVPYLPEMTNGEVLIVVETWMAFVPFLNPDLRNFYCGARSLSGEYEAKIGETCDKSSIFGPFYFESLVPTRPRFAGQLVWED